MTSSISSAAFRESLAQFASGVTIVTTRCDAGPVGFTASAFSSVSLEPPLVLVCVGKRASAHEAIIACEHLGISVLAERHGWIAEQFARQGIDRFRDVPIQRGRVSGVPLIEGALAQLECRLHTMHEAGDHTIVIGEVLDATTTAGRPLLHFARRFGAFVAESAPPAASQASSAKA